MWHLMWLTTLCFVCYLSGINYVVAAPIDSADEAAEYLERFGYLERGPQDSSYSESVKAESFIDAIKDFQSFAGLKKTGELDKETLELINKPRCGVADRTRTGHSSTRRKRFAIQGSHWPKKQLTYKIKKYTEDMPKSDVDREIARAFQMWADVTDLTFVHVNNTSADVDIDILFASGEHGSCPSFNDGPGRTLAHATYPIYGGDAHFDDGETWTLDSVKGTNLFQVATHEFGHSLGLEHTHVTTAVMYPFYGYSSDFKLDKDDIEGIQELYGKNQFSRKLALELEATLELFRTTVNNLEKKNIELRNDLIDTRTNLNTKLEGLKPSQPSNSCSSASPAVPMEEWDVNSFETRPLVRSSFNWAQSFEIAEAIFDGRLGNCMGDRMRRGYHLSTNQYLMSQNRQFAAILQEDGNFVIYKRDKGGKAEFSTVTAGKGANQVQLRNDGHITVIDKSKPESPLWKSRRNAEGGDCFLIMQDDGNLVGYKGTNDTSRSNAYFSAWNLNL
ncbi:hatching enzyme-like isoform X1 [Daphnia pulex]|uniref:hatching enzyme-like isoform X1 n=1 Tax=Daphnia pulex TaxID=6669 RepID=UPI001EE02A4F|nr:hatching enzyme-like isoform X1 [Daphnia pulex]